MGKDLVSATVFVEQDSQKGILIGRGGAALKQLGSAARTDIEAFLGEPSHTSRSSTPACRLSTCSLQQPSIQLPRMPGNPKLQTACSSNNEVQGCNFARLLEISG